MRIALSTLILSVLFPFVLNGETKHNNPIAVVNGFFAAFGKGDLAAVVASFHENASIIAVRDVARKTGELYGSYSGKKGAEEFVTNLGKTFDTKEFVVETVIGNKNVVFANGRFKHELKSTGKIYESDWALKCVIKNDKIIEYRFYEDTSRFEAANR
ncbi:nuclear transport factor 2 family protein [Leptospira gomenensis]|uniref:Nuclear transport factor 2 family protein n=1 Tax=Leptospira gomenensis TaxID=2484974 RepID=A0A5F1YZM0_9LEPT|nr:nuclear transport factor 2 family protein [Leptospira gomenensis]TGK29457.1 nuclear transport factor 2 family protein [Leptospira gomenensis]TGK33640.1 nuclear transport factor 2 family protein [Leptospira gomenensis]TGK44881.1 nuclear transport factor 2 family protein [Leptospira gomenensis]TGK64502.1 nuclear transport factor 2 family protein [Leptospira gomenensis]